MSIPSPQSPTHAPPRITVEKFISLLKSKNSPAVPEANAVWGVLLDKGVDPSFALAQYRVESQYGTEGHAKVTGSWGNMLFDKNLTILASGKYAPGNGYTYATYDNFVDAITDYCRYLAWYRDEYNFWDIYRATARWIGKAPGSPGHTSYVTIVVNDMIEYEFEEDEFYEVGDKMIAAQGYIDKVSEKIAKRIFVPTGTILYRGTNGDVLKKLSPATGLPGLDLLFFGLAQGSPEWGLVLVGSTTAGDRLVYIKNPDLTKLKPA